MEKKNKRELRTIYPNAKSLKILGYRASNLNRAIDAWAHEIENATEYNADCFNRLEWCFLADLLNSTVLEPSYCDQKNLSAEVEDAAKYNQLDKKWRIDVSNLSNRILGLSWARLWALYEAVRFYWDHYDIIDLQKDQWWTIQFRLDLFNKKEAIHDAELDV
jgi:hypothetical protein